MKMIFRNIRLRNQFLFVVGLFCFITLTLHLMSAHYDAQYVLPLRSQIVLLSNYSNTKAITLERRRKVDIWTIRPGDDRLVDQLQFMPKINDSLPPKTILVNYGTSGWSTQAGKHVFIEEDCLVKNCELADYALEGRVYDARIFKENDLHISRLAQILSETPRHYDQIWMMFALESPEATPSYNDLNHVINWTLTYRTDSTIVTPYDKWVPYENSTAISTDVALKNYAKGKTKTAAIFVSNCHASNDRLGYIEQLKKYIHVDVYGQCGDQECGKFNQQSCFEMLRKDYKFYFAFENANCRDYITEKLFLNALRHDVLPVVMGAHPDEYKRMAPPGSFIHVEDFGSPKDLAKYLHKLDTNDHEYNKYFRWKDIGNFIKTKFWCRLCSMLWDPERPSLSVENLDSWWRGNNTCIGRKRWDGKS